MEDNALLKAFRQASVGLFPAPAAIEKETVKQYGVRVIGWIDTVRERLFAVSVERRIQHPAVVAMVDAARTRLFCQAPVV